MASHRVFDFPCGCGQRHSGLCPHSQTLADRVSNVCFGLGFTPPLAHAAGDGWTLGNENTIFILVDADQKLHASILTTAIDTTLSHAPTRRLPTMVRRV